MFQVTRRGLAFFIPRMLGLIVLLVIGSCCPKVCHAATGGCSGGSPTWTAASPSAAAVQACLSEPLQCGDTIIVPAGSASWESQVTGTAPSGCLTNQGLTIEGATTCSVGCAAGSGASFTLSTNLAFSGDATTTCGATSTCITIASDQGFELNGCGPTSFCTLEGFTFIAGANGDHGLLSINGTHMVNPAFRLTDIHWINTSQGGVLNIISNVYGLVDHMRDDDTVSSGPATMFNFYGDFPSRGYANWEEATNLGSNQAVYIEDSVFDGVKASNSEGFYDAYAGCKVVIRYTVIDQNSIGGGHGTDSGNYRGCVLLEAYNNIIADTTTSSGLYNPRSGTTVFFDNTVTGSSFVHGITLTEYRISEPGSIEQGGWGAAGPGLNWTPMALPTSSGYDTNTLNAPDWQASHSYPSGATIGPASNNSGGQNFQSEAACTSGGSRPTFPALPSTGSATVNDGTCMWKNVGGSMGPSLILGGFCAANPDTPASSNLTCSALVPGDTATRYFDANGGVYPFRDQPCFIHNQVSSPCYAWNNTLPASLSVSSLISDDGSGAIQSGRDYFNNTQAPGYTPYTYPHPLQSGGTHTQAPVAPAGLVAVVN